MKKPSSIIRTICFVILFHFIVTINPVNGESDNIIRMAHVGDAVGGVDVHDANIAIEVVINKLLSRKLVGYRCESVLFTSQEPAIEEYMTGTVDIINMTTLSYLKHRNKINIEPSFVAVSGGRIENTWVILVRKNTDIKTIENMKDTVLTVEVGINGDIALLWLDTMLMEKNMPESIYYFKNVKRVNKVSQAVLPVFFKQADVAIVRRFTYETMVDLNPQVGEKLMILTESQPFLFAMGCLRPGLDPEIVDTLKKFSSILGEEPEGRQLLLLYSIDKVVEYKPEFINNIEELYNKNKMLKQKRKNTVR